jgi:hypothetical protein
MGSRSQSLEDVHERTARRSLAALDPSIAQAIQDYAVPKTINSEDLEALRAKTRRPRLTSDEPIILLPVWSLDPNPVFNGEPVFPANSAAATLNVTNREVLVRRDDMPTRLLNTRLSVDEQRSNMERRVLSNSFVGKLKGRYSFAQSEGMSADVVESARKLRQSLSSDSSEGAEVGPVASASGDVAVNTTKRSSRAGSATNSNSEGKAVMAAVQEVEEEFGGFATPKALSRKMSATSTSTSRAGFGFGGADQENVAVAASSRKASVKSKKSEVFGWGEAEAGAVVAEAKAAQPPQKPPRSRKSARA